MTADHYALAKTAIEAKNEHDAQAALYLLRSDILRMATDSLTMQAALANLYGVTNAVDKEDWDKAHSRLLGLKETTVVIELNDRITGSPLKHPPREDFSRLRSPKSIVNRLTTNP